MGPSGGMPKAHEGALDRVEELIDRRRWLRQQLVELEHRYDMSAREFMASWSSGELPEPEDPGLLADFLSGRPWPASWSG